MYSIKTNLINDTINELNKENIKIKIYYKTFLKIISHLILLFNIW